MITPLVSIGITSYNRPKTLGRAIESVINQTYSNMEIIISDDCSTNPEVEQVISKYVQDKRVQYIRQPLNIGMVFNQNFVLEKATGNFFMRLADDDWLDLNYIESCITFLIKNPEYSSAYGHAKLFDSKNVFLKDDVKIDLVQERGVERIKDYLSNVILNGTSYGLVRRKDWHTVFIHNTIAADWLPVMRLAFEGKYKMLEYTHSNLSAGGISSTTDGLTQHLNMNALGRSFPYLTIAYNVASDILQGSKVYKRISIIERVSFATECFLLLVKRFSVKEELKKGAKKYIKNKKTKFQLLLKEISKKVGSNA